MRCRIRFCLAWTLLLVFIQALQTVSSGFAASWPEFLRPRRAKRCIVEVKNAIVNPYGADGLTVGQVEYEYRDGEKVMGKTTFDQTERGFDDHVGVYPPEIYNYHFLRGKRVLDVGTGAGRWVKDVVRNGVDAVGIDAHLPKKLQGNPRFHEQSFTDLKFKDHSFDVVISSVMFHYQMPLEVVRQGLAEMGRVCKPGGIILIKPIKQKYLPLIEELRATRPDLKILVFQPLF